MAEIIQGKQEIQTSILLASYGALLFVTSGLDVMSKVEFYSALKHIIERKTQATQRAQKELTSTLEGEGAGKVEDFISAVRAEEQCKGNANLAIYSILAILAYYGFVIFGAGAGASAGASAGAGIGA